MIFSQIFIAIFMALVVGLIFYYGFKISGPWNSLWSFLLILMLVGIVAETWVVPMGPAIYGVSWLGGFLFILFFALLIAAATPPRRKTENLPPDEARKEIEAQRTSAVVLGLFFWVLIIVLSISVIWSLFYAPPVV